MKVFKPILIFIAVFSVLFLITILFVSNMSSGESKENIVNEQTLKENQETSDNVEDEMLSVEETVNAFVAVIYDYDTSERAFYEGAEEYMTELAFRKLVPLQTEEESQEPIHMISTLDETKHYYREITKEQIEVLSEIWYRVSGTGNFRIRQILKLRLTLEDRWLIQECSVLDTLEE